MRRSRWSQLLAAVLALLAGTAAARPRAPQDSGPDLSRFLALKPLPADPADGTLRKLQKERFNTRLEVLRSLAKSVEAGALKPEELTDLVSQLTANGVDLEDKPEGKVKWAEMRLEFLRGLEHLAERRAGDAPVEYYLAKAARIDAEIEVLKLKEALKPGK
jgi:hypothetical protein